jgi:hypothetical protein
MYDSGTIKIAEKEFFGSKKKPWKAFCCLFVTPPRADPLVLPFIEEATYRLRRLQFPEVSSPFRWICCHSLRVMTTPFMTT